MSLERLRELQRSFLDCGDSSDRLGHVTAGIAEIESLRTQLKNRFLGQPDSQEELSRMLKNARNEAYEKAAQVCDADADRQELAWKNHLASGVGGPSVSYHALPRKYAQAIRELKE